MRLGKQCKDRVQGMRSIVAASAATAAALLATAAPAPVARAADSVGMVTWSISGSTAMRNFTINAGFSALEAGAATLTLSNGTYTPGASGLQLAPNPYTGAALTGSSGAGVRIEWHEQGSVEGVLELVNDQIGYVGGIGGTPIIDPASRVPSTGNRIFINRGTFSAGGTSGGYTISGSAVYNTYDGSNYNTGGTNLLGGQNRVQMAISDVNAVQGFSKTSGTAPVGGTPVYSLVPGNTGYGKGNSLLTAATTSGLGTPGGRQQLVDDDVLNMKTTLTDPQTGASYGTGAWNTAGVGNTVNKTVAITATTIAANPGTGLTRVNKTDAQFLQVAGRLANGVDFNVTERDVNSGTRNVFALNTGVDPAWAAGDNDDGNGNPGNPIGTADSQASIGANMRFSGKTAGGAQLRPTVQNNRMAVGPLSLSDARSGSAASSASSAFPIRALAYSNTATDSGATFVQPSAANITDGSYVIWQNQTYVTVRTPDANYADNNTFKGDASGDISKLQNNILNSVSNFPNPLSGNNPADALLNTSFILPQMMLVTKQVDGGATTDVSGETVNGQTHSSWRTQLLGSSFNANFSVVAPELQTDGNGSNYGVAPISSGNSSLAVGAAAIPITAQDSAGVLTNAASAPKGNYLFGNFNQTGVRDFDAVKKAQAAQAALDAVGAGAIDCNNTSVSNNTKVLGISAALDSMNAATGPSKGDLIVMGDFNGDGKFDGKDLYYMARGAAVTDSMATSTTNFNGGTLSGTAADFGDKVRSAQLRKNAALDYMNSVATPAQKVAASANLTNDPTGTLAFNKSDVNRDGLIDLKDGKLVDYYVGKKYTVLGDQAVAVKGADGDSPLYTASTTMKPISLVDVELNDSADGKIDTFDFGVVRAALGSQLKNGDANFDGHVTFDDYVKIDIGFNTQSSEGFNVSWGNGDFNSDGVINFDDYVLIDIAFNQEGGGGVVPGDFMNEGMSEGDIIGLHRNMFGDEYTKAYSAALAAVPEPASIGTIVGVGAALLLGRRRNRRR